MDPTPYLSIICAEAPNPYWRPTFCTVCAKPKISHPSLTGACKRAKISQSLKTKYELACKSNETMELAAHIQAAKIRAANLGTPNSGAAGTKYDIRTKEIQDLEKTHTPHWKQDERQERHQTRNQSGWTGSYTQHAKHQQGCAE